MMLGIWTEIKRLHRDETGPPEASTVLIMALIGIPLILVLISFGDKIAGFLKDKFTTVSGTTGTIEGQKM